MIKNGVKGVGDEIGDTDEIDAEAFDKAYVTGACISLVEKCTCKWPPVLALSNRDCL